MKVETKLVITDELKLLFKSFESVSRSNKTAYVFMSNTTGNAMTNSGKMILETRTAERNTKILKDLANGVGSTTAKTKETKKPRRKYIRKKPIPVSNRSLPARNPVFLTANETKAINSKAKKILGDAIDPIKQYAKIVSVLSELMVFYFKKHIEQGMMENGPVAPLKALYEYKKNLLYGKLPILVRTGQLLKSFSPRVR